MKKLISILLIIWSFNNLFASSSPKDSLVLKYSPPCQFIKIDESFLIVHPKGVEGKGKNIFSVDSYNQELDIVNSTEVIFDNYFNIGVSEIDYFVSSEFLYLLISRPGIKNIQIAKYNTSTDELLVTPLISLKNKLLRSSNVETDFLIFGNYAYISCNLANLSYLFKINIANGEAIKEHPVSKENKKLIVNNMSIDKKSNELKIILKPDDNYLTFYKTDQGKAPDIINFDSKGNRISSSFKLMSFTPEIYYADYDPLMSNNNSLLVTGSGYTKNKKDKTLDFYMMRYLNDEVVWNKKYFYKPDSSLSEIKSNNIYRYSSELINGKVVLIASTDFVKIGQTSITVDAQGGHSGGYSIQSGNKNTGTHINVYDFNTGDILWEKFYSSEGEYVGRKSIYDLESFWIDDNINLIIADNENTKYIKLDEEGNEILNKILIENSNIDNEKIHSRKILNYDGFMIDVHELSYSRKQETILVRRISSTK